jgi:tetratricopeptide (TPR) repeat protein
MKPVFDKASLQAQAKFKQAQRMYQQGQYSRAKALLEAVNRILPKHADALILLGLIAEQENDLQAAVDLVEMAKSINPDNPVVYLCLGNIQSKQKKLHEASKSYSKAITLKTDYVDAYYNCAVALQELKEFDVAMLCYDKVISIKPDHFEAYNNRGNILRDLKKFEEALKSFDKAISLKPDNADAYYNSALVLQDLNELDAAMLCYDTAISLNPDLLQAYVNRSNTLKDLRRFDAALWSLDEAIAIDPDFAEAHWNKSILLLMSGDFNEGWREFEWRWRWDKFPSPKRNFDQPLWTGNESVAGKTILLHSEQGLGDAIQFARYTKMVSDAGFRVIFEIHKPLEKLFEQLPGVSQRVVMGDPLPPFDMHCPLLSLPFVFKTSELTIPAVVPYLSSNARKVAEFESRLGEKKAPRVGLVWSGNQQHTNDHNRSIKLFDLWEQLPEGCQYVSLQKEVRPEDQVILEAHPEILSFGSDLNDFSDTAALCELMDIIISVDTSVAHLAGALGKKVWILLPYMPDWRWLLDRDDSPWYPTATLYRQKGRGEWKGVLETVTADLLSEITPTMAFKTS